MVWHYKCHPKDTAARQGIKQWKQWKKAIQDQKMWSIELPRIRHDWMDSITIVLDILFFWLFVQVIRKNTGEILTFLQWCKSWCYQDPLRLSNLTAQGQPMTFCSLKGNLYCISLFLIKPAEWQPVLYWHDLLFFHDKQYQPPEGFASFCLRIKLI